MAGKNSFPGRVRGGIGARAAAYQNMEENWEGYLVPPQPESIPLPSGARIPHDFRQRVYELLMNWFKNGTDICTFTEAFNVRYGMSIAAEQQCNMPLNQALHLMADIVDTGRAAMDRRVWIRPVDYEVVKEYCSEEEIRQFKTMENEDFTEKTDDKIEDPQQLGMQIRSEVKDMIAQYEDGIPIENLAIRYGFEYHHRGINRSNYQELTNWLLAMPDLVQVFDKEENGQVRPWTKLVIN